MRNFLILSAIGLLCFDARQANAIDPYAGNDPYWVLLHEPAVHAELALSPAQQRSFRTLLDELDVRYFPLRNKSPEEALAGAAEIISQARAGSKRVLQPAQQIRLDELLLQYLGNQALLHDEVVSRLKYSDAQKQLIKEINDATQTAVAALQKEAGEEKTREALTKKFNELQASQQKKLVEVLKPEQQLALQSVLGRRFDLSKLGQPRFRAPEFVNTGEWINSSPLKLADLRGRVVVIHFYAFGCINCVRNYPWYRQWRERFEEKDVAIIGIHTPETANERDNDNVRRKAADEGFKFPILIDGKNENWNAWGNSMWPSVYLVDKHGYLRDFWPGELKWQGKDGEKYIRQRIEELRVERDP